MCITWSICGGAHPAALGSNSFFLDHHQFLGKSCLHNASSSGLGRNGRAFCGFQVTTVMRILRRDGLDGQQDILFLSLLSWCFTSHKSLHVLSLLFLFFFPCKFCITDLIQKCVSWPGVSHRKGGLQILVDKDTGDGVDGRAELEVFGRKS